MRDIIAFGKVRKKLRELVIDVGATQCIYWPVGRFSIEEDRQTAINFLKKFSRELRNYTSEEISEVLSAENLKAIHDILPLNERILIPNNNWNRFFINREIKCTHSEAKFIRMALMCPSCGFVGGC